MSVPGPVMGPCQQWIDGDDVAACCAAAAGVDAAVLETAAVAASHALFQMSGRLYTGMCQTLVRPCADRCGCFGIASGIDWRWGLVSGTPLSPGVSGLGMLSGWTNDCGDRCGCPPLQTIRLAGYPVREMVEVKVDGTVVDPSAYRLDRWRELVRVDGGRWPGCQNLALADTEPGTFSIEYVHGVPPPDLGIQAAQEIACQIVASCNPGAECALPANVTRVTRQGVTVEKPGLVNWLDAKKPTGLPTVDLFLQAHGGRQRRRSSVWSPDVRPFPRRISTRGAS